MKPSPFRLCLALAIAGFCMAGDAFAQLIDGTLTGRVNDPSGAVVPAAAVVATNEATGVQFTTATTARGEFRIEHVPVGVYDLKASSQGFVPLPLLKVAVDLNRTTTVSLGLALASTSSIVPVVASATVDEATSQVENSFGTTMLINIPDAANNNGGFLNLSLLSGGVASPGGLGIGYGPAVGGMRPTANRFYIEGADNNSYFTPAPLAYISNEAIEELAILQNNFGPEFGGAPGGIFNAVVKAGTNEFHGSLYEYNQNRDLNALDAVYARQNLTSPPRFDSNRLGAAVGGPIVKDKLFFFASFEYHPIGYAYAPPNVVYTPTATGYQILNGLVSYTPGYRPTNLSVFEKYVPPSPVATSSVSVAGTSIPVGPLSITAPAYENSYRGVGSLDWDPTANDRLRARYLYTGLSGIDTNTTLPAFFVTAPSDAHFASMSEYHSFSASTLNELRLNYTLSNQRETASNFNYPGLSAFPNIYIYELGGLDLGPDPNVPQGTMQGDLQASEMLTSVIGRHSLKAGYQFNDIIMTTSFFSYPRGLYEYLSLNTFLEDLSPDLAGVRWLGATGPNNVGAPAGFLQNAAYFNDDFKLRPNLTLNLGVRYEYVTVPIVARAQELSALASVPGVLTLGEPQPSKTDWSPRVGFAWSPGTSGVWSVRGGFDRAFDMPFTNTLMNTAPEFYGSEIFSNPNALTPNFLANGGIAGNNGSLSSVAAARAYLTGYIPNQVRPYALNYTLSVQRRVGKDYLLEARYLGSRGEHLLLQTQLNRTSIVTPTQYIPTFLTMPSAAQLASLTVTTGALESMSNNPWEPYGFVNAITAYEPIGVSEYNGLILQATRRYSRNLSFVAAYTWSHMMDDSTATVNTTLLTPRRPQDFNNIAADWASSMLDRRQRFTFSPVYDFDPFTGRSWVLRNIVGNWNLAFTYTYESPEYATVQSNVDSNLNGDTAADRAIINPAGNPLIGSGVTGYTASGQAVASTSPNIVAYVANNPNARYIVAGVGALANGGRNTFPLDPINNVDASLRKRVAITERVKLEIGIEAFNLLNHPQFTGGVPDDVSPVKNTMRTFLVPSSAQFGQYQQFFPSNARFAQLLARITF